MLGKILLTGASGFIGSAFVNNLSGHGFDLRLLTRQPMKLAAVAGCDVVQGDLEHPASLHAACQNIDVVLHLAGFAHVDEDAAPGMQAQHQAVNYEGSKNLMSAAIEKGVKQFIYFSSVKAHTGESAYGNAKRQAEEWLLAAGARANMQVTVFRPPVCYGPRCKGNLYSMLRMIDKRLFPPLPHRVNKRSMLGVDDLCQATILALHNPIADGKIYTITDGKEYSSRQLFDAMHIALHQRRCAWAIPYWLFKLMAITGDILTLISRKKMPFQSLTLEKLMGDEIYSVKLLEQELGFKPQYCLQDYLPAMVAAYKNQEVSI